MVHIPEGNYLTLIESAARAGVSRITVQKWIERGQLPAIDISGLGRIVNEKELTVFLDQDRPRGYPKGKPRTRTS